MMPQFITNDAVTSLGCLPEYSPCGEGRLNIQEPRDLQTCIVWHQLWHPKPKNHELQENEFARLIYNSVAKLESYSVKQP